MINENFVIVGALLSLAGGLTYLTGTIKGVVKPNRVTWLIWSIVPLIAFVAQVQQGVGAQSLLTFMTSFTPLLILIASFINKESYWNLGRLDILCGVLSVCGLGLWAITAVGNAAIFFSIVADGFAAIPTIVKGYRAPETEDYRLYLLSALSAAITLLTIKTWSFEYFAWPLYILLVTLTMTALVRFKLGRVLAPKLGSTPADEGNGVASAEFGRAHGMTRLHHAGIALLGTADSLSSAPKCA